MDALASRARAEKLDAAAGDPRKMRCVRPLVTNFFTTRAPCLVSLPANGREASTPSSRVTDTWAMTPRKSAAGGMVDADE